MTTFPPRLQLRLRRGSLALSFILLPLQETASSRALMFTPRRGVTASRRPRRAAHARDLFSPVPNHALKPISVCTAKELNTICHEVNVFLKTCSLDVATRGSIALRGSLCAARRPLLTPLPFSCSSGRCQAKRMTLIAFLLIGLVVLQLGATFGEHMLVINSFLPIHPLLRSSHARLARSLASLVLACLC